jgi:hypothetical protein
MKTNIKALALGAFSTVVLSNAASADQQILDDLIVTQSLCVGQDCNNGESFGFDTVRLKENNLRLHFDDTSTSASFPSNDWRLVANDSANGGQSYMAIEDSTAGRIPFRIRAGAPADSLYVSASGLIGVGTGSPVVEMHIANGDTPTLRLEQDGSSGFTPQTWDVAGNETNFFVRDATNGSKLSFRIRPSAPESSIDIAANGNVGMGTSSPQGELHIRRTDASPTVFRLENANAGDQALQIRLISNSDDNRRIIATDVAGTQESQISMNNGSIVFAGANVNTARWATVSAAGIVTDIGTCTTATPCDAVFDPSVYAVPSIEDHAQAMWENQFLPAVGPTKNGPVNLNAKMTGILNELEHAHIYIEQLNARIVQLEEALNDG